jgi:transposase-like protein
MKKKLKTILTQEERLAIVDAYNKNTKTLLQIAQFFNCTVLQVKSVLEREQNTSVNFDFSKTSSKFGFSNELVWLPINIPSVRKYEISNFGSIKSYTPNSDEFKILKGRSSNGYFIFEYRHNTNNRLIKQLIHRIVALHFLETPQPHENCVLHIDGNKNNNHVLNLRWASISEAGTIGFEKQKLQDRKKIKNIVKLTQSKVDLIRKILANPNRTTRKKMIAKQFGISTMTLYRIEAGLLWKPENMDEIMPPPKKKPKLKQEQLENLKKDIASNNFTGTELAEKYNTSSKVISSIKTLKVYK